MSSESIIPNPTPDADFIKWAIKNQTASMTTNLLNVARSQLVVSSESLDTDPLLLNVENGTIDLRTGDLHAHCASDLLTKCAPVKYDQDARSPVFEAFVDAIFKGRGNLIKFVQKALGYSITGDVSEQAFFIQYGTGSNGKSTLEELIACLLGDYATACPPGLLTQKKHESHPTDLADLFGKRFVMTSEVKADARWDEERIKMLTGGDTVRARRMREDFWQFEPTHKLWISVNNKPITNDSSFGFWRRVRLIPFEVTFPKNRQDKRLLGKLKTELPGILNWLIEGCLAWQNEGLGTVEEVEKATADYQSESNTVELFIEERCERDSDSRVQSSHLFGAFKAWSKVRGDFPISPQTFSARLKELGLTTIKNSVNFVSGLKLRVEDAPNMSSEEQRPRWDYQFS